MNSPNESEEHNVSRVIRKKQNNFGVLVAGHSRAGKSSLIETFKETLSTKPARATAAILDANGFVTTEFVCKSPQKLNVRITEAPGLNLSGCHVLDSDSRRLSMKATQNQRTPNAAIINALTYAKKLTAFINTQFHSVLAHEQKINRAGSYLQDPKVHITLYAIDPITVLNPPSKPEKDCGGHPEVTLNLTESDWVVIDMLRKVTNVIIVFTKTDTLSTLQLSLLSKASTWICSRDYVNVYSFAGTGIRTFNVFSNEPKTTPILPTPKPYHSESSAEPDALFDVINGYTTDEHVLGRKFRFGYAELMNPAHCDYVLLINSIFDEFVGDLMIETLCFYEKWRTLVLERRESRRSGFTMSGIEVGVEGKKSVGFNEHVMIKS